MKTTKILAASLVAALMLPIALRGQDKPETKPLIPLRVQVVFSEYEGEKKIATLPYTIAVNANEREPGIYGKQTSLRMGIQVPIGTGKNGEINYQNVGTDIDCWAHSIEDGSFRVSLSATRSSLYTPSSDSERKSVGYVGAVEARGEPMIRRFNASFNLLLRDGQTLENTMATDPVTGHLWKIAVTLHIVK
jgi:hypothetical protein